MFLNDFRYAVRRLAKSPGFVAMAVVALALGIGANTNIFSFVNVYLLHPLPTVKNMDGIVYFEGRVRNDYTGTSYLDFLDFSGQSRAFSTLAPTQTTTAVLVGRDDPERVLTQRVTPAWFDVFTVRPALGRAFVPGDTIPAAEPVILISDRFWQRHFAGRRDAVGQPLTLDTVTYKVIGVMPPRFRTEWNDYDCWTPLAPDISATPRARRNLGVYGRLKPGVTLPAAQQEINTIVSRLAAQYPASNAALRVVVRDLLERLSAGPRESISILVWVVAFVLLIACSNVANLQLARATGRAGEIAVRIAIGASRWRIVRQVLLESTLVALAGGVLGFALSYAGARLLVASIPARIQPMNPDFLDSRVILFTIGVTLLTGIISGIAPAFQVSHVGVNDVLKEGGRGNTGGSRGRLRNALVVVEVSLALILLLASGLLIRSFLRMQNVDPGFRTDHLLTAFTVLPDTKYPTPEQRAEFFRQVVERAGSIPGVRAAGASTALPLLGGGGSGPFMVEGQPVPAGGSEYSAGNRSISAGYFQTMGIPLRRGRYFNAQDTATAPWVIIVNERLAQQYFPHADPLGKRLRWGRDAKTQSPWMTIVGVTADVKPWSLAAPSTPEIFLPQPQNPPGWSWIVLRTDSPNPASVAPALRAELRALDRDQPLSDIRTMQNVVDESVVLPHMMSVLMAIFATIALVMAAMGIYGVISYSVAQRTQELGIRMALGAGKTTVIGLVLRQAAWTIGIGVAIGVLAAAATTRMLQSFLYGVGARDPVTFVSVPVALALIGLAASYIPAVRATRVDPVVALRRE